MSKREEEEEEKESLKVTLKTGIDQIARAGDAFSVWAQQCLWERERIERGRNGEKKKKKRMAPKPTLCWSVTPPTVVR